MTPNIDYEKDNDSPSPIRWERAGVRVFFVRISSILRTLK